MNYKDFTSRSINKAFFVTFWSWQWHSLFRRLGNNNIIHSITSLLIGCIVVHLNESPISIILIYLWCLIFLKKQAAGKILWPTRVRNVFFRWLYKQINWVFILRGWTVVLFMTIIKFVKAEIKLQSICFWNVFLFENKLGINFEYRDSCGASAPRCRLH